MPVVSVLSVRTACPAASAFSDDAISSLGLAAAFEASRPSGASVSSGDDAIKLADTAKNGKHGDRARARSSCQVGADRWTFLLIVSVSFLWLSFGSLLHEAGSTRKRTASQLAALAHRESGHLFSILPDDESQEAADRVPTCNWMPKL